MVALTLIFKQKVDDKNKINGFGYGWNHYQG